MEMLHTGDSVGGQGIPFARAVDEVQKARAINRLAEESGQQRMEIAALEHYLDESVRRVEEDQPWMLDAPQPGEPGIRQCGRLGMCDLVGRN